MYPSTEPFSSSLESSFRRRLEALAHPGTLNGHLIVRSKQGFLDQTNFIGMCLEKLKGLLGFCDLADPYLVEFKTLQFLIEGRKWIKSESDKGLVKELARRVGLTPSNTENHTELDELIRDINQSPFPPLNEKKDSLLQRFQTRYSNELKSFPKEILAISEAFNTAFPPPSPASTSAKLDATVQGKSVEGSFPFEEESKVPQSKLPDEQDPTQLGPKDNQPLPLSIKTQTLRKVGKTTEHRKTTTSFLATAGKISCLFVGIAVMVRSFYQQSDSSPSATSFNTTAPVRSQVPTNTNETRTTPTYSFTDPARLISFLEFPAEFTNSVLASFNTTSQLTSPNHPDPLTSSQPDPTLNPETVKIQTGEATPPDSGKQIVFTEEEVRRTLTLSKAGKKLSSPAKNTVRKQTPRFRARSVKEEEGQILTISTLAKSALGFLIGFFIRGLFFKETVSQSSSTSSVSDPDVPVGLTNKTNFCYQNSVIQALLVCKPFMTLLKTTEISSGKSPNKDEIEMNKLREAIRKALRDLLKCMENREDSTIIDQAQEELRKAIFDSGKDAKYRLHPEFEPESFNKQLDASSYLELILTQVLGYEQVEQPTHSADVVDPADKAKPSQQSDELPSAEGNTTTDSRALPKTNPYLRVLPTTNIAIMSVDLLDEKTDFQELVDAAYSEKTEKGIWAFNKDRVFDEYKKTVKIISEPKEFVVVRLNRSRIDSSINNARITFPENGTCDFSVPYNKKEKVPYEITSFVYLDAESTFYGHYYSYVKKEDGRWYCCNDTRVSEVTLEDVQKKMEGAYLFIFEKSKKAAEETKNEGTLPEILAESKDLREEGEEEVVVESLFSETKTLERPGEQEREILRLENRGVLSLTGSDKPAA